LRILLQTLVLPSIAGFFIAFDIELAMSTDLFFISLHNG
jgi:hypothetical protein